MSEQVICRGCGRPVDRLVEAQCSVDGTDLWSPDGVIDSTEQSGSVSEPSADTSPATPNSRLRVAVRGREFFLADGDVGGLGRSIDYPLAEYFADCDNVSRVHALIRFEAGKVYVTDTDSANGTFVNERKLQPHSEYEIRSDQRLRLAADVDVDLDWSTPSEVRDAGGRTRIEGA